MARTRTRTVESNEQKVARRTNNHSAAEVDSQEVVRKDRPTPSARDTKAKGAGTGLIYRLPVIGGIAGYFRGVASEMQKVTWPNREETTHLTTVVLAVTITFAIALGILDGFFGWWFQQAFHADSEWIFLAVAGGVTALLSVGYFAFRDRI